MTGFLASVRSAEEALLALEGGTDIIDAKEPAAGALGRLAPAVLRAILGRVGGKRPVSATIGDVALEPETVLPAAEAMAALGVDIIKIGLFDGDLAATLAALAPLARRGVRLVAVAFADRAPDLSAIVPRCAAAGFYGAMLDTADKASGSLTAHLGEAALAGFITLARRHGLVSGLAGSLRRADIPALAPLGADYLGFRTALTAGDRSGALDPAAFAAVRAELDQARSSATATAGAISAAAGASANAATGSISSTAR